MELTPEIIKNMKRNASLRSWSGRLEQLGAKYNRIGARILDIGIAGDVYPGGHAYIFPDSTYETLDIDGQFNPTYTGDAREMPFSDEIYDVVLFVCTLEHIIEDRDKAIKECYRVLKPGGTLIIIAPEAGNEKNRFEEKPFEPVTSDEIVLALPGKSIRFSHPEEYMIYAQIIK